MFNLITRTREKGGLKIAVVAPLLLTFLIPIFYSCTAAQQKVVAGRTITAFSRSPIGVVAGAILSTVGEMEHNINAAEAGAPEINVSYNSPGASSNTSYPNYNPYSSVYDYRDTYGADPRHIIDLEKIRKDPRIINAKNPNAEFNAVIAGLDKKGYINLIPAEDDLRVILRKNHPILSQVYGTFLYNEGVDFSNDGQISPIIGEDGNYSLMEFKGLGKKVFNINEPLYLGFYLPDRNAYEPVTWRSFTADNEFIGETTKIVEAGYVENWFIGPNSSTKESKPERDFLDKIKDRGLGKYKVVTTIRNDPRPLIEKFEIVK